MKLFNLSDSTKSEDTTKKCHDCLANIPAKAKKCRHCGSRQKTQVSPKQTWITIGVFLLFMIMIFNTGDGSSNSKRSNHSQTTQKEQKASVSNNEAFIMSQPYVEAILKSPSTAEFPVLDYKIQDLGEYKYRIISYVDSQNSFGATIRSNFSVTLSYKGSGDWADTNNWTLHKLIFDGEDMYSDGQ